MKQEKTIKTKYAITPQEQSCTKSFVEMTLPEIEQYLVGQKKHQYVKKNTKKGGRR